MAAGAFGVGVAPRGLRWVHPGCWGAPELQELRGIAPCEAGQGGGLVGLMRLLLGLGPSRDAFVLVVFSESVLNEA